MRTNKMITKEKMPCSTLKFSQLIFKGNVWRSGWRIYMWTLGLKGLIQQRGGGNSSPEITRKAQYRELEFKQPRIKNKSDLPTRE